jgi:hypothetical protein
LPVRRSVSWGRAIRAKLFGLAGINTGRRFAREPMPKKVRAWRCWSLGANERQDKRRDARARLDTLATGLVHRRAEEPAAIFSYLALVALDLQRLRDGILRRALFRDEPREVAA